jgi:hypothetical protein
MKGKTMARMVVADLSMVSMSFLVKHVPSKRMQHDAWCGPVGIVT